jgi:hypothetical protein
LQSVPVPASRVMCDPLRGTTELSALRCLGVTPICVERYRPIAETNTVVQQPIHFLAFFNLPPISDGGKTPPRECRSIPTTATPCGDHLRRLRYPHSAHNLSWVFKTRRRSQPMYDELSGRESRTRYDARHHQSRTNNNNTNKTRNPLTAIAHTFRSLDALALYFFPFPPFFLPGHI